MKRRLSKARARLLVAQAIFAELRHHADNGSEWLSVDTDGEWFDERDYQTMCDALEEVCDMLERRADRMEHTQKRKRNR